MSRRLWSIAKISKFHKLPAEDVLMPLRQAQVVGICFRFYINH
ncbi:unnamed protein product [Acidithrix sp. C25]|nr:unnamed protein product [Acidithrix sp. C25]